VCVCVCARARACARMHASLQHEEMNLNMRTDYFAKCWQPQLERKEKPYAE